MDITRNRPDTLRAPEEWTTGTVWMDPLAAPPPPSRLRVQSIHFTPGARTCWHSHPFGQILQVTEGSGRVQLRGGPIETIRAGDTVLIAPHEWHWHGAGPRSFMTHIAIHEIAEDGSFAEWGEKVGDDEYPA